MGSIEELLDHDKSSSNKDGQDTIMSTDDSDTVAKNPAQQQKPSSEVLIPLIEQWIEKGTKEGAFNMQSAYAIYLSLQLLRKEPHSKIVTGTNIHTRALAAENLNIACNVIQSKGGIFKSVEQGAQVYETVLMLKNIIANESKSPEAQDDQSHRTYSEQNLIPDSLKLKPELQLESLISILEDTIRKGYEVGAIALDKSAALASALRLLRQNPGDVLTTGGDNPVLIMNRLQAFQVLVEGIDAVVSKAKLLGLHDYVLIWPIIVLLNDYFQKEAKEPKDAAAGSGQQQVQAPGNANKKRKSTSSQD